MDATSLRLWKVNCMEHQYPGMWQRWYKQQCVAVGWHAGWGFRLAGPTDGGRGWHQARKALKKIAEGDVIVVALRNHRVGRLGRVVGKEIGDEDWNPLVPPGPGLQDGEMGRRILVRWDLTVGPDDREQVVALPEDARFTSGELRPTIARIRSLPLEKLSMVMDDPSNWVGLLATFRYERALSNYIAAYPHRLEDGLLPHPNAKVRERVFDDKTRLDILLIDRDEKPVIVECKQYRPSIGALQQIRRYMERLEQEIGIVPRGILVHGGAKKLPLEVVRAAAEEPPVEIVHYQLQVDFTPSAHNYSSALVQAGSA